MLTHLNLLMSAISMIRTHRLVHDDTAGCWNDDERTREAFAGHR